MDEVVMSRLSEELVAKVDRAVSMGYFRSRSEALRAIVRGYLEEHPELFLGEGIENLLATAPNLSDEELENLGSKLFRGVSVAKLVAEGRGR